MNKTFRGRLADGSIERIRLSTNNGLTGYQVVKFQLMGHNPGDSSLGSYEHVVQVFTREPSAASAVVNFDNPQLLAVGFQKGDELTYRSAGTLDIIFDSMKFNQDIFIAQVDTKDALNMNYYLELEQVKLSLDEATVATLKDMRGRE